MNSETKQVQSDAQSLLDSGMPMADDIREVLRYAANPELSKAYHRGLRDGIALGLDKVTLRVWFGFAWHRWLGRKKGNK